MKKNFKYIINKFKNNGFTLVELLAVIVVLAIIAFIGFAGVGSVIKTSREKVAIESTNNYIKAVNVKIMNDMTKGITWEDKEYDVLEFPADVDGKKPSSGTFVIKNSKVDLASFIVNGVAIEYTIEKGVTISDVQTSESMNSYSNGTVVYFNPTTNTKCNNYVSSNSASENTEGCLKWYAYLETNDRVNLLLDHNVVKEDLTYWYVSDNLFYRTSAWNQGLNIRMISVDDISSIVGLYDVMTSTSIKSFNWLYDNDAKYWISLSDNTCSSFAVNNNNIVNDECDNYKGAMNWYGARPVITVNKSLLR